ncbi:MAG: hypothetical protein GX224_03345 [Thermoplasmatales archaeon]|nr:hypothetical protein [Thermoplasmatales archaeon]
MKITVRNVADGSTIRMEVAPGDTVADIIDSAAEFWGRDAGAYVIKKGKTILDGGDSATEANLMDGDVLEMIPDPEGGGG